MTWQPIGTAPKDGTAVQCWCAEFNENAGVAKTYWVPEARFAGDRWEFKHSHGWFDANMLSWVNRVPTHWMPQPEPPTTTRLERERMEGENDE